MPLGIIPAGTGNGMIKSLLDSVDDSCSVTNATLVVIRGHKCSLDVVTVSQGQTRFFSILMLAWGLIADIDIESEKYRWMGSARLDFYALLRIIYLRKYNGRVSFVPAPGYEAYGEPSNQSGAHPSKLHICGQGQEDTVNIGQCGYQGPPVSLNDLEWRTIDGPFISVWLHNVPWGSEDTMAAPNAKFSDGYLDLIIMRDCTRASILASMSKLNDGSYVKLPNVLYLKVKAFVLEPGQHSDCPTKGGIIDSDGEVLARGEGTYKSERKRDLMVYDSIQMTVDQGLATLFSPVDIIS
ncbi:PREDICTED: sphingosine kinase 2-like isoform X2 [Nelumbo nucifera]|nr:PREDICTED: sphingosine kinase 2-like isoform X2 [Nelumbo nucifera]